MYWPLEWCWQVEPMKCLSGCQSASLRTVYNTSTALAFAWKISRAANAEPRERLAVALSCACCSAVRAVPLMDNAAPLTAEAVRPIKLSPNMRGKLLNTPAIKSGLSQVRVGRRCKACWIWASRDGESGKTAALREGSLLATHFSPINTLQFRDSFHHRSCLSHCH